MGSKTSIVFFSKHQKMDISHSCSQGAFCSYSLLHSWLRFIRGHAIVLDYIMKIGLLFELCLLIWLIYGNEMYIQRKFQFYNSILISVYYGTSIYQSKCYVCMFVCLCLTLKSKHKKLKQHHFFDSKSYILLWFVISWCNIIDSKTSATTSCSGPPTV